MAEATNPVTEVAQTPVEQIAAIIGREDAAKNAPEEEVTSENTEQESEAATEGEPEAEVQTDDPADGELEEVDYEGDQYRVPKKLKEALLRHSDYTRKTQELAEQRRLIEATSADLAAQRANVQLEAQFNQEAVQDIAQIKATESTIAQFKAVDWDRLSDSDPVQAQKLWFQYQNAQNVLSELKQTVSHKYQQFQSAVAQNRSAAIQQGLESLKKDIPGWGPELANELSTKGMEYYGFSQADMSGVQDPRAVKMLADAVAYRKLQASRPELNKRVSNVPKTVQPGAQASNKARQKQGIDEAKTRLRKSGKVEDAAALIAKFI